MVLRFVELRLVLMTVLAQLATIAAVPTAGHVLVPPPDSADASVAALSQPTHAATTKIFNVGVGKTGTASVADYMWRVLEYGTVLHASGAVYHAVGFHIDDESNATASGEPLSSMSFPAYDEFLAELTTQPGQFEAILRANISAYHDSPWAYTFQMIEQTLPDAKVRISPRLAMEVLPAARPTDCLASLFARAQFVIWPRATESWVESAYNYFCDGKNVTFDRSFLLEFGRGDFCLMEESDARALMAASYDHHLVVVRSYFGATPERAAKYLELDLLAEDAGQALCGFVYDAADERCEGLTNIPEVGHFCSSCQVLDPRMNMEARAALAQAALIPAVAEGEAGASV